MNVHSHYENLKVTRDAPPEVIRAAYKALAQNLHPDRNKRPGAAEYMVLVNTAYDVLSDLPKRLEYDAWLAAEEMKWTFAHPTIQPGYVTPRPEPAAPTKARGAAFEIDEQLFTQAMKKAKQPRTKRNFVATYFRICALYGALGTAALLAKITFAG